MALVRSFTVGKGDMFYINHNSDNFTIIDCQLFGDHKDWLVDELKNMSNGKGNKRFISTHPDEDHIQGLDYLDQQMPIQNFYVVENQSSKSDESESFKYYRKLRDDTIKAFYVKKGCQRKWINLADDTRSSSGISILWPDPNNKYFRDELQKASAGEKFNNISLVARYQVENSASFMWVGDLETPFMENIYDNIDLRETTVVFAPHHGRESGKLPDKWLAKIKPKIIVIGEAEKRYLHHYTGYREITQTKAGDISFLAENKKLHCYASYGNYGKRSWLKDENRSDKYFGERDRDYYIGTLNI